MRIGSKINIKINNALNVLYDNTTIAVHIDIIGSQIAGSNTRKRLPRNGGKKSTILLNITATRISKQQMKQQMKKQNKQQMKKRIRQQQLDGQHVWP